MEMQQLEQFVVIAECENLTKAAQKLHVSQPSLSRSLHALEDELGTTLFDRVGRNIVLNNAGRIALDRALVTLSSVDSIKRDVEEFVHQKHRTVNIYAPVPMGFAEEIIIDFKRMHPDIHLRIGSYSTTYADRLKRLQPDITFFASPIVHKGPNFLMLGEEDIVLAVSRENPLAQRTSVRLADLSGEPFIRLLPSTLYDIVQGMFLEAGFEPNLVAEVQDYDQIMAFVAENAGLTLAPAITWFGRRERTVAGVHISDVNRKRYLYLKWPENTVMNEATLQFRSHIIKHFNERYGFNCSL